jgi:hypothetical protein
MWANERLKRVKRPWEVRRLAVVRLSIVWMLALPTERIRARALGQSTAAEAATHVVFGGGQRLSWSLRGSQLWS